MPDPSRWIRCIDHVRTGRIYPVNPDRIVCFAPAADGYWEARDVLGHTHRVSTDEDARVEALMGEEKADG